MLPVLFSIGNFHIYGYGLCMALGIILGVFLLTGRAKKKGYDPDLLFNAAFFGAIGGVLGSKILYIITELRAIIEDPSILLDFGSGFVIYGGVIGGILASYIYLHFVKKVTTLDKYDLAMPSLLLGQGLGRIGCFLAGCCYGAPVPEGAWYGITFPAGSGAPAHIALYPVQPVSAIFNLLFCLFLLWLSDRAKFRGQIIAVYLMVYAVARFIIEYFRDDPRGAVGPLTTSQFIGIFMFAGGLLMYLVFRKKALQPFPGDEKSETAPEKGKAETEPIDEKSETAPAEEKSETAPAEEKSEEIEVIPGSAGREEAAEKADGREEAAKKDS